MIGNTQIPFLKNWFHLYVAQINIWKRQNGLRVLEKIFKFLLQKSYFYGKYFQVCIYFQWYYRAFTPIFLFKSYFWLEYFFLRVSNQFSKYFWMKSVLDTNFRVLHMGQLMSSVIKFFPINRKYNFLHMILLSNCIGFNKSREKKDSINKLSLIFIWSFCPQKNYKKSF